MNVVLIGYRGTGKSTVGTLVSKELGWNYVSTDAEIIQRAQLSIPEIVQQSGWDYFRDLESAVCKDFSQQDHCVIDTGGGIIVKDENIQVLKPNARIFWLTATVSTITQRIEGDTQRPSLTGGKSFVDEITEVLNERSLKYQAAADYIISTDHSTPEAIVAKILVHLHKSDLS